jgi:hypothetical protein
MAKGAITYDFVCVGGKVLPYLKRIFAAGHGSPSIREMPAQLGERLSAAMDRIRVDEALVKEVPKHFPGTKAVLVNDSPDFIAEGGRIGNHFNKLFKAGQEMANKSPLTAFYHRADGQGWLLLYADSGTDIAALTEFIELNMPRWQFFDLRDQLPGQDAAADRKFPVSARPGTEEAKQVLKDEVDPAAKTRPMLKIVGVGWPDLRAPLSSFFPLPGLPPYPDL